MGQQENPIIAIKELAVGYGTKVVAQNINFTLEPGILCGIVGVNGVGKSTLLRTLANFQPKLSGNIEIQNKNLEKYAPAELAQKLSVVPAATMPPSNMTCPEERSPTLPKDQKIKRCRLSALEK